MRSVGKTNEKVYEVEILRFLAAVTIICYHAHKQLFGDPSFVGFNFSFFCHGYIAVEFFFVLSGILMGRKLYELRDDHSQLVGKETVSYTFRKIERIFPEALLATLIDIIVITTIANMTLMQCFKYFVDSFWSILMVKAIGFYSVGANGVLWYITILIIGTVILYFLGRKNYDTFVRIVFPLGGLLIIGYIDYSTGMLSGVYQPMGFGFKCFWRGIAEMAIGCSLYEYIIAHKERPVRKAILVFNTVLLFVCLICLLIYATFNCSREYEFHSLFIIIVVLWLLFTGNNYVSGLFKSRFWGFLGQISLTMYVNQMFCIRLAEAFIGENNLALYYLFVLILDIVTAIIVTVGMKKVRSSIKNVSLA